MTKRKLNNTDLRHYLKEHQIYMWEVARYIGVCDSTLSRRWRLELPEEDKALYRSIVDELAEQLQLQQ